MRLHRFFIETPIEGELITVLDNRLIHQWKNVFRYTEGGEIILFDGSGFEYQAKIENLESGNAQVKIISKKQGIIPDRQITLYQSLIKKDKMEWIAEKATELGVYKIVPIISERSEKKGINVERIRKIMIEASEQCGRADVPEVGEIMNLESGIMNYAGKAIVFDPSGSLSRDSYFINHNSTSFFIGPEGGWSDAELDLFKQKGAQVISLGSLTLRAETAAIVAISKIQTSPA